MVDFTGRHIFIKLLVLENGKSDFVKEKLSILGEKYDAASAILYFKSQK